MLQGLRPGYFLVPKQLAAARMDGVKNIVSGFLINWGCHNLVQKCQLVCHQVLQDCHNLETKLLIPCFLYTTVSEPCHMLIQPCHFCVRCAGAENQQTPAGGLVCYGDLQKEEVCTIYWQSVCSCVSNFLCPTIWAIYLNRDNDSLYFVYSKWIINKTDQRLVRCQIIITAILHFSQLLTLVRATMEYLWNT